MPFIVQEETMNDKDMHGNERQQRCRWQHFIDFTSLAPR